MGVEISYEGKWDREEIEGVFSELRSQQIAERIWQKDYTVWKPEPKEIINRLGWLTAPSWTLNCLPEIEEFVTSVRKDGFERVLLLGMGGSSLAPDVISRVMGFRSGHLPFSVLDTTDPAMILKERGDFEKSKTLVIVSSKSGTTVETDALMKYFYRLLVSLKGQRDAARHMVAITDAGSSLDVIGKEFNFRHVFLNDPDIGGRFSALSLVGMVPAALVGLDVRAFLERAHRFALREREKGSDSISAGLGACLGEWACHGKDKLTLFVSPSMPGFNDWLEQLVAESTGKEGKGLLPVPEDPSVPFEYLGPDRVMVEIKHVRQESAIPTANPKIVLNFNDLLDLAPLFFLWEFATAVAGWRLGVNPFDQPDVETAKKAAKEALREGGEEKPDWVMDEIEVYGAKREGSLTEILDSAITEETSYIALQVYLTPTPRVCQALQALKTALLRRYRKAVTVGFGPRYLHSTGQLHKGDAGKGVFLQFTEPVSEDVPIPERMEEDKSALTFGTLRAAQARGDYLALLRSHRRVLRFHFCRKTEEGLTKLARLR